jgi:hypothetical protein
MKRLIFPLILGLSFIQIQSAPVLVKSDKIADIITHVQEGQKTLVLFDIHWTLGYPLPWLIRIEKDSPGAVQTLQANSDLEACALTASMPQTLHRRIKELKKIGFDFSESTPFNEAEYTIENNGERCLVKHEKGVICAGLCTKKEVIKKFLQEHPDYKPEHIIIVDDKKSCLFLGDNDAQELNVQKITNIHFTRIMGGVEFDYFKPISRIYKKHTKMFYATIAAALGTLAYRNRDNIKDFFGALMIRIIFSK